MTRERYFLIRMDDITPDMDWDKFAQIREIFEKYNVYPLLGVVPDCRDTMLAYDNPREDFWEMIRLLQKQGWMIAQHGTNHCYATDNKGILGINPFSEFAGLTYEEQLKKIETGKKILEENGVYSNIFMAPGHTYDKNTLKALNKCGFRAVTDGLAWKPYISEGLLFVPCRLQKPQKLRGLDTLCLHSNLMLETDINELEDFCRNNQESIYPFIIENISKSAIKRNVCVAFYEKGIIYIRNIKERTANSKTLAWYMQYTYDKNSKKKLLKRIGCLPVLLVRCVTKKGIQ